MQLEGMKSNPLRNIQSSRIRYLTFMAGTSYTLNCVGNSGLGELVITFYYCIYYVRCKPVDDSYSISRLDVWI